MKFQELLSQKDKEQITYSDLLQTTEWKEYRLKILKADDFYCTKCGLSETLWHDGKLISFNKSKFFDSIYQGERIIADFPFESEKNIYLHVHHKYYILGRLPWEYTNEALTTLCNWCHWELHQKENIKVYIQKVAGFQEVDLIPCKRCRGAGIFPEYSHVQAGICFRCHGSRYEELINFPSSCWFK